MALKSKASRDSAKELAQKLFSAEEKKGINNHLITRYISHASQEYAEFKLPQTRTNCSSNNSKKNADLIVAHYLKIHNMNESRSFAVACLVFNSSITRILLMIIRHNNSISYQ